MLPILQQLNVAPVIETGLQSESTAVDTIEVDLTSIDIELLESEADLRDITDLSVDIDTMEFNSAKLENLSNLMSDVATNNLTDREKAFVAQQINEINEVVGEGFVTLSDEPEAGLQSMADSIKKATEYVFKMIHTMLAQITIWWRKFNDTLKKLKEKAKSILKAADKYSDKSEIKEVKSSRLLYIGTRPADGKTIPGAIADLTNFVSGPLDGHCTTSGVTVGLLVDIMVGKVSTPVLSNKSFLDYALGRHFGTYSTNTTPLSPTSFLGSRTILLSNPAKPGDSVEKFISDLAGVRYTLAKSSVTDDVIKPIPRLSKDEVKDVASNVVDLTDNLIIFSDNREATKKLSEKSIVKLKNYKPTDDQTPDAAKLVKSTIRTSSAVASQANTGITLSWISHVVNVANAALKVANASI